MTRTDSRRVRLVVGLLEYSDGPLVSSDIINSPASCVFDSELTMAHGHLVKVLGWYDNESGYASRLVDLAAIIGRCLRGDSSRIRRGGDEAKPSRRHGESAMLERLRLDRSLPSAGWASSRKETEGAGRGPKLLADPGISDPLNDQSSLRLLWHRPKTSAHPCSLTMAEC